MGKKLRVNFLIIALIFLILAAGGIAAAFTLGKNVAVTAIMYGSGTEQDPYRIYTSDQLSNLQEITQGIQNDKHTKGKYFKLCRDVTLTTSVDMYVGEAECSFYGVFDGCGHTVKAGNNVMFRRIAANAQVKNLNVEIDLHQTIKIYSENRAAYCGLAVELSDGGVIENCNVKGNINIRGYKYGKYAGDATVSGICNFNYGTIRNCTYSGNITGAGGEMGRSLALRYVSGIAACGNGIIESCTFNGDIVLTANAMQERVAGISFKNTVKNSTFNGNLKFNRYTGSKNASYLGIRVSVYGISQTCENGMFNGDILSTNRTKPSVLAVAGEGSTFVHNGIIKHTSEK